MYAALAVCFFVVDSKCNVVRLMIMRDKLTLADDLAKGGVDHIKSGAASKDVAIVSFTLITINICPETTSLNSVGHVPPSISHSRYADDEYTCCTHTHMYRL